MRAMAPEAILHKKPWMPAAKVSKDRGDHNFSGRSNGGEGQKGGHEGRHEGKQAGEHQGKQAGEHQGRHNGGGNKQEGSSNQGQSQTQDSSGTNTSGTNSNQNIDFSSYTDSASLDTKAWEGLNAKDYGTAEAFAQETITRYSTQAKEQQASLSGFAPSGSESQYWALNDVATAYFISGSASQAQGNSAKAQDNLTLLFLHTNMPRHMIQQGHILESSRSSAKSNRWNVKNIEIFSLPKRVQQGLLRPKPRVGK